MTTSPLKELYNSPNGDRWILCKDMSGRLLVSHLPNDASGGRASETEVALFLSQSGHGPEQQALLEALSSLGLRNAAAGISSKEELSAETIERLSRALAKAVARCWSRLPQDVQQDLFESAVTSEGERIRLQLAIFLHSKHSRTVEAVQERAVSEPDSLGG